MDWEDLPFTECVHGTDEAMLQFAVDRARRQFAWNSAGLSVNQR